MLMRRVLDRRDAPVSEGAAGSKVFVFTDDLDVTNRLYHATRDAEGLGPYRQDRRPGATPLASLRATAHGDLAARRQDGQAWDLAERLGHDLSGDSLLTVTRVSSQDAGVNERSDLIVATASLEVGFNDPGVGAVLQHKAPRDEAAFLQRRGRAGRTRTMRPWTVVTLSDFGRDRLAYEAYDSLFDPTLRPRPLPISNRAVLRVQATYAWLDWMARRLAPTQRESSVWRALAGPDRWTARQRAAIAGADRADARRPRGAGRAWRRTCGGRLRLTDEQVERCPVGTAARARHSGAAHCAPATAFRLVPPLAQRRRGRRRLPRASTTRCRTSCRRTSSANSACLRSRSSRRRRTSNASEETHSVPILQAMRTFAPGNVSLRFAVERRGARSWVAAPDDDTLDLATLPRAQRTARNLHLRRRRRFRQSTCPWVRPWRMRSEPIPDEVTRQLARPPALAQPAASRAGAARRRRAQVVSAWQSDLRVAGVPHAQPAQRRDRAPIRDRRRTLHADHGTATSCRAATGSR